MALNSLLCADVSLRNCSLTHCMSVMHLLLVVLNDFHLLSTTAYGRRTAVRANVGQRYMTYMYKQVLGRTNV